MATSATQPAVILIGPPGAGKSTVGRLVAETLSVGFLDTDAEVERTAGVGVPEIFRSRGEAAFRDLEHAVVTHLLTTHDGVLALGGGAVLHEGTRRALVGHRVVFLDVDAARAVSRVAGSEERPLLAGDPVAAFDRLMAERRGLYRAAASVRIDTGDRTPRAVAELVLAQLAAAPSAPRTSRIRVSGATGYDVVVGHDLGAEVRALLGPADQVLLVHPPTLTDRARGLAEELAAAGYAVLVEAVPDAEQAKTLDVVAACWDLLGAHRFGREDVVVGLGGGATTDLAGFVAATWLRGVRLVNVPTTLLGMVDAAVGGKTGINTGAGKNLVGAFHPPAGVVCDLDALATVPAADLRAGLAEVVKCGFIADAEILRLIEADGGPAPWDPASEVLRELVERAIAVKAAVVGEDLREAGPREILNYGHTFAHAIEHVEGYRWRHGDAVAVGMVFAAELARAAGIADAALVRRHLELLTALGLPVSYPAGRWDRLEQAMRRDKKVRGGQLRFVVLSAVGRPTIARPTAEELQAAYSAVSR